MTHWNHGSRVSQQVEKLCVTPCIEILQSLTFDRPASLSVAKSRNRRRRTEQDRILLHLCKKVRAGHVAANPCVEKRFASKRRLRCRPLEELFQDRAEVTIAIMEHWSNQHAGGGNKELLPQQSRFFQTFGTKRLNLETRVP